MGVFGVAVSFDVEMWPVVVNTDQFSVGHSTMGATDEIIGRGGFDGFAMVKQYSEVFAIVVFVIVFKIKANYSYQSTAPTVASALLVL